MRLAPELQVFVDELPDTSPVQVVGAVRMLQQARRLDKRFGVPPTTLDAEAVRAKVRRLYKTEAASASEEEAARG